MRQWLAHQQAIPRWLLLFIVLLLALAFYLVVLGGYELYRRWDGAECKLIELKQEIEQPEVFSADVCGFPPPSLIALAELVEMRLAFLCSLGIFTILGWSLLRRKHPE